MIDEQGFRANVAMVICNRAGQVLWCQRSGVGDAWQFPQGGIKAGESAEDALYRELKEEVGLDPQAIKIIASNKGWLRYRLPKHLRRHTRPQCIGQKQRWFLVSLEADERDIDLNQVQPAEFVAWRWASYWYPINQVVDFKRSVYRRALKALVPAHTRFVRQQSLHQQHNL